MRSNLSFLLNGPEQPRLPRYARNDRMLPYEAISLFCLPALDKRDRTALLHCHCVERSRLSLRACEAISLFCLTGPNKRDCRASLAMTGCSLTKQSLFCALPALNKRDCRAALGGLRFVIASLRSNLSFLLASPEQSRLPRCARNDKIKSQ